jgi:hypothetical protein
VSIGLAAVVGAARGVDVPAQVAWGVTGGALALGLLLAPAEAARLARQRHYGAAIAATLLAVVCASFVLSGSLGNASAGRVANAKAEQSTSEKRSRAQTAYDEAKAEIAALGDVRLPAELEVEIAPLSARIGRNDCSAWVPRKSIRQACSDRSPLLAELARAKRKAALERAMSDARSILDATPDQHPANEDARTIARYLSALGMSAKPERVSDALIVVAVLSLELGGALALIVGRSIAQVPLAPGAQSPQPPPACRRPRRREQSSSEHTPGPALSAESSANVVPLRRAERGSERAQLERAMAGIIEHAERGTLPTAQRAMARLLRVSAGTVHAALNELERSGRARVLAGPNGTLVRIKSTIAG